MIETMDRIGTDMRDNFRIFAAIGSDMVERVALETSEISSIHRVTEVALAYTVIGLALSARRLDELAGPLSNSAVIENLSKPL